MFISFGGVKTGANSACGADATGTDPIERVTLTAGMLMNHTVQLPLAFGSTSIWIDEPVSGATGASPTIYFRNAFIDEAQTPPDLTATNATFCSPFNGKFLVFDHARGAGQLVVGAVYNNAFTITDTGAPPGQFNSIYVYAFGQPPPEIVEGRVITTLQRQLLQVRRLHRAELPAVHRRRQHGAAGHAAAAGGADLRRHRQRRQDARRRRQPGHLHGHDLQSRSAEPDQRSEHRRRRSRAGRCTTSSSWTTTAPATTSPTSASSCPSKVLGTFDPLQVVGKTATFTGMLRNNSGQNPYLDSNGNAISCSATRALREGVVHQRHLLQERVQLLDDGSAPPG